MSTVKSLTAAGVATGTGVKHAILFGITVSTSIGPTNPASGDVVFEIRDSAAADGTGDLIARLILAPQSGLQTITFPAGVRCGNGIAVNITNSAPDAHSDLVVSIDYS